MWKCSSCAEECEDNFDLCWKCGTGRDGSPPAQLSPEPHRSTSASGATGRSRERVSASARFLMGVVIFVPVFALVVILGMCLLQQPSGSPFAIWMSKDGLGSTIFSLFLWFAALVLSVLVTRLVLRRMGWD